MGKRMLIWEQTVQASGVQRPVRRVLRLIERTIARSARPLST